MNNFTKIIFSLSFIGGSYGSACNIYVSSREKLSVKETIQNGVYGAACGVFWPVTLGYMIGTKILDKPR